MNGEMPPGYDKWRTATPWDDEPDHVLDCPRHENQHSGEHAACLCPTQADLAAEKAEAQMDAQNEPQGPP